MCLRGDETDEKKDKYESASWSEEDIDLQNHIGLLISDKCKKKKLTAQNEVIMKVFQINKVFPFSWNTTCSSKTFFLLS